MSAAEGLRIREVVAETGVAEATLRAWERRYGFPVPQRLPSGHRRYARSDVEILREISQLRESGVGAGTAIERARRGAGERPRSIFAELRRRRPELPVNVLPKRALIAICRAIEDEAARGAEDLVLFGAFQRERHYRESGARWRELAQASLSACAFADFERRAHPPGAPLEVPITTSDPLAREWSVVADVTGGGACLAAWEPPGQGDVADSERRFETVWTTDPEAVRDLAHVCCRLAGGEEGTRIEALLREPRPVPSGEAFRAEALASRMVAYLSLAQVG